MLIDKYHYLIGREETIGISDVSIRKRSIGRRRDTVYRRVRGSPPKAQTAGGEPWYFRLTGKNNRLSGSPPAAIPAPD